MEVMGLCTSSSFVFAFFFFFKFAALYIAFSSIQDEQVLQGAIGNRAGVRSCISPSFKGYRLDQRYCSLLHSQTSKPQRTVDAIYSRPPLESKVRHCLKKKNKNQTPGK